MTDICDYIYASGFRFKSGTIVVTVSIDNVERRLAVVRNGKGRSRIDRWSSDPVSIGSQDNVVGEINLRDLRNYLQESQSSSIPVSHESGVVVMLDPGVAMGRAARELDPSSVDDALGDTLKEPVLGGIGRDAVVSFLESQLESAPYGAVTPESSRRVNFVLSKLEGVEMLLILKSCRWEWMRHTNQYTPFLTTDFLDAAREQADTPEKIILLNHLVKETASQEFKRFVFDCEKLEHILKTERRYPINKASTKFVAAYKRVFSSLASASLEDLQSNRDVCERLWPLLEKHHVAHLINDTDKQVFWLKTLLENSPGGRDEN